MQSFIQRIEKMANDLNRCEFIGRLGKDVELRYTPTGSAVANISIAVGESWKDQAGTKQEKTTWVPVVIFGKLAEIAGQYLTKGSKVFIAGKFSVRKWQDQQGNDRYSTEVVVDTYNGQMQMLDGRPDNGQQPGQQQAQYQQQPQGQQQRQQRQQPQQRQANHPAQQSPNQYQQARNNPQQQQQYQGADQYDDDIPFNGVGR